MLASATIATTNFEPCQAHVQVGGREGEGEREGREGERGERGGRKRGGYCELRMDSLHCS